MNVILQMKEDEALINSVGAALKAANKGELVHKAESVINEGKNLKKELDSLNQKAALAKVNEAAESAEDVKGVKLVKASFNGVTTDALRSAIDAVKDKEPLAVCVFASIDGEKVAFVAGCGKEAVAKGAHAGMILKNISPIVGGGGGGRPDNAASGGKNSAKTDEALAAVNAVLEGQIK